MCLEKVETFCRNATFSQNREASFHEQRAFKTVECLITCTDECYISSCTASFRLTFIGLLCKAVSTSATLVFPVEALLERYLSAINPVSSDRCTKRVFVDVSGAVFFFIRIFLLKCTYLTAMRFCSEIKFHDSYSLLLEKHYHLTLC
ncbi:hypothetical protein TNCT_731401 [Trichonephila clavata]|uniref:Uncharacterized protein n=1 Tax=Trichonephila clavata TaxID=2740835 RepID=A0A8X6G5R9_TRICU|nr:hypothetical protein TNCT_731401 [Trichonephila clavata]